MDYRAAKRFILAKLRTELSTKLYYHGMHHTLDVLRVARDLCKKEGVDRHSIKLVKTAALFHDSGFVKDKHAGHEYEGCQMARAALPKFGYTKDDIETICGMIMATKIPQSPTNLLEEIICDADLDYLGRADFYPIGETLFQELKAYNLITGTQAWNRLQVDFLTVHHFYTETNTVTREPLKQRYLADLKKLVAGYDKV